jgi:anthranilate/para-aminobenzoate synthase component II
MQGMVTAYGGEVTRIAPAHGDVVDVRHDSASVFAGLRSPVRAVRYHSLAATHLPEALAATAWCDGGPGLPDVVMGVRHRYLPLHGVQFHPESILSEQGEALVTNFLDLS